ncbi:MAG: hypothetical protein MUF86_15340, partial [Akkermansiaceae bacterium]|nr:hypothetical protein [Akkermansiaceae bacterium]
HGFEGFCWIAVFSGSPICNARKSQDVRSRQSDFLGMRTGVPGSMGICVRHFAGLEKSRLFFLAWIHLEIRAFCSTQAGFHGLSLRAHE